MVFSLFVFLYKRRKEIALNVFGMFGSMVPIPIEISDVSHVTEDKQMAPCASNHDGKSRMGLGSAIGRKFSALGERST